MSQSRLLKAVALAACFAGSALSSAQANDSVTLYASNNSAAVDALLGVVAEVAPELDVQVVSASTGSLLNRIEAEADRPQADVLWSAGFSTLSSYQDYFAPHETDAGLPADMVGEDNLWNGSNVHVMVLMVNERQLRGLPQPETWSDLFEPEWEGKFVFGDPANSSSAYAQLFGLYTLFGREGLEKLARNAVIVGSSSSTYTAPAAGEYPVGITMEYSAHAYVAGGQEEIQLVYPSEGTFLSPEGMAILKGAPNAEAAAQLLDVMASEEAQAAIFEVTYRRPANLSVDVEAIAGLPPMEAIEIVEIDQNEAAASREELIALWQDILAQQ